MEHTFCTTGEFRVVAPRSTYVAVSRIVADYRRAAGNGNPVSLRQFASALSVSLEIFGRHLSPQTIKNWADQRYLPDPFLLKQIAFSLADTWQTDFAGDILAVLEPDEFSPVTEIGRRAIASAP